MFFRRERPRNLTFQERLENLRKAGFAVTPQPGGVIRISRENCAVDLKEEDGTVHRHDRAGIPIGSEIGMLVDGGYQKFFSIASGNQLPTLAAELKAHHDFEEEVKEAFGESILYNDALRTVSPSMLYDRVRCRDCGRL